MFITYSFTTSIGQDSRKFLRPPPEYTNTQWQKDFAKLKQTINSNKQIFSYGSDSPYENFLYSVLSTIRRGKIDYCFYAYQITDLLKYEKNLKSRWLKKERQFRLWL